MDNLTYNAADIARMLNRSPATAYRIIKQINIEHCKENNF